MFKNTVLFTVRGPFEKVFGFGVQEIEPRFIFGGGCVIEEGFHGVVLLQRA